MGTRLTWLFAALVLTSCGDKEADGEDAGTDDSGTEGDADSDADSDSDSDADSDSDSDAEYFEPDMAFISYQFGVIDGALAEVTVGADSYLPNTLSVYFINYYDWSGWNDNKNQCIITYSLDSASTVDWTEYGAFFAAEVVESDLLEVDARSSCDEVDPAQWPEGLDGWALSRTWGMGVGVADEEYRAALEAWTSDWDTWGHSAIRGFSSSELSDGVDAGGYGMVYEVVDGAMVEEGSDYSLRDMSGASELVDGFYFGGPFSALWDLE